MSIARKCCCSSMKIDDICIISVYNSPNSSFDVLKKHLNKVITISKRISVRLLSPTGYSVQAFYSIYARTRTTGDGNCLYTLLFQY